MSSDDLEDEIGALEAIFCCDGEFSRESESCLKIKVDNDGVWLTLDLLANGKYPTDPPGISITATKAGFTRKTCDKLTSLAKVTAAEFVGQHCILSIIESVKSALEDSVSQQPSEEISQSSRAQLTPSCRYEVIVVQLDHIRQFNTYTKHLKSWSLDSGLETHLIISKDRGLVLVALGSACGIGEFMTNWKSQNVDVDSRGRPCKERMIKTVLRQEQDLTGRRMSVGSFAVHEVGSLREGVGRVDLPGQIVDSILS